MLGSKNPIASPSVLAPNQNVTRVAVSLTTTR